MCKHNSIVETQDCSHHLNTHLSRLSMLSDYHLISHVPYVIHKRIYQHIHNYVLTWQEHRGLIQWATLQTIHPQSLLINFWSWPTVQTKQIKGTLNSLYQITLFGSPTKSLFTQDPPHWPSSIGVVHMAQFFDLPTALYQRSYHLEEASKRHVFPGSSRAPENWTPTCAWCFHHPAFQQDQKGVRTPSCTHCVP